MPVLGLFGDLFAAGFYSLFCDTKLFLDILLLKS